MTALEAQAGTAEQRDPDHEAERRRIAVPADRRLRRVALQQDLHERRGLYSGEARRGTPGWLEPLGNRLARAWRPRLVVVAEAEVTSGPTGRLSADHDRVKAQRLKAAKQFLFLLGRDHVASHEQALRFLG